MIRFELRDLFIKYFKEPLSTEEFEKLAQWIEEADDEEIENLLNYSWNQFTSLDVMDAETANSLLRKILTAKNVSGRKVSPGRSFFSRRAAVAASLFLLVSFGVYYLTTTVRHKMQNSSVALVIDSIKAPDSNQATITLANGRQILLSQLQNGDIARQGNVKLVKSASGQIQYQNENEDPVGEVQYNTIFNPRGSKIVDMLLSDGSHIWLNTESSITFPVAFVGKERRISMTGEAYFEVAHTVLADKSKSPFIVQEDNLTVTVTGTHFNISGYNDNKAVKTSVLEGSVMTEANGKSVALKPGQQSALDGGRLDLKNNINMEDVLAWKNGYFFFDKDEDFQQQMQQVSRWYNVVIVYEGGSVKRAFGGKIAKSSSLSDILRILSSVKINYKTENNKIMIMP